MAHHLEHEGKYQELSKEHNNAMDLLKQVDTVAARVPGSHASQIHTQNEIRNYFGVRNTTKTPEDTLRLCGTSDPQ